MSEANNAGDAVPADRAVDIGKSIRALRGQTKVSLREIARRAGITPSLLSQIENGRVNPSVATLFRLAETLDVPVARFFAPDDGIAASADAAPAESPARPDRMLVRAADRPTLPLGAGIVWTSLTGVEQPGVRFVEVAYPPGARSANVMLRHGGRDFLVVIEGQIVVQLEFTNHVLDAGDTMWFESSIPHQVRNESAAPTRLIAVTVDPWPVVPT
jgi:transcriptional regulator with XRE-family HTH domain